MVDIQNIEVYSCDNHNYLLIHKNACSSVLKHFIENYGQQNVERYYFNPPNDKIYWTVIRDPYDRFISGITYDIINNFGSLRSIEKYLSIETLKSSIFNKVFIDKRPQKESTTTGTVSHTSSQWLYLFNQKLDFVVDIKDLDVFFDMHFERRSDHENILDKEYKLKVMEYLESNNQLKRAILDYLTPDYLIFNQIQSQGFIWNWQKGKMF